MTSRARPSLDLAFVSPEQMFARNYSGGGEFVPDGRHAWLQLTAESAYISMVAKLYD